MRIALMGSAPSSVAQAPLKNGEFYAWTAGKARPPGTQDGEFTEDWELWGCSPGCWAVTPKFDRFFEVHRWQPGMAWFSAEYCQFLRDFKGPVYTGAAIPEIPNHVIYPIDAMEAKFSSYFFTSSLALMMALAIDTIEKVRKQRRMFRETKLDSHVELPPGIDEKVLDETDADDVIGMWGVDMAAMEEYSYQRPGCQFFVLEAMRRGIGVFLPKESDLMRPMPVYGISEWDHNYVKLTSRARELNERLAVARKQAESEQQRLTAIQGEISALNHFVNTWTSPYGMQHGLVVHQTPGTGLGGGITHLDARPIERIVTQAPEKGNGELRDQHLEATVGAMKDPDEAMLDATLVAAESNDVVWTAFREGFNVAKRSYQERNGELPDAMGQPEILDAMVAPEETGHPVMDAWSRATAKHETGKFTQAEKDRLLKAALAEDAHLDGDSDTP